MPKPLASPLQRFRGGELGRDGYVDAMIEEALAPIGALPSADLELVRSTLRALIEADPFLADLVRLATCRTDR